MHELFQNKLNYLIKNNLKWDIDFQIPIEFKHVKKYYAQIHLYKKPRQNQIVVIHDLRNNRIFESKHPPSKINLNMKLLSKLPDEDLDEVLLHELNHWYTEEYFTNVRPHGKEFKYCGRLNGLSDKYNRASPKIEGTKYHVGRCSHCNKIVCSGKSRKEIIEKSNIYLTKCCSSRIKYDYLYVVLR